MVAEVDEAVARGGDAAALVLLGLLYLHADDRGGADPVTEGLQLGSLDAQREVAHVQGGRHVRCKCEKCQFFKTNVIKFELANAYDLFGFTAGFLGREIQFPQSSRVCETTRLILS